MNLHNDLKLYSDSIRATSQYLGIKEDFIEKDYWITKVLHNLSSNKFSSQTVFKGGTSLSKAYNLIARFSEDIDIAILHNENATGNHIKNIIRTVSKNITTELQELDIEGISSKGSRFRKSVYQYLSFDQKNQSNKLILEINSFANPYPYNVVSIASMIYQFLFETDKSHYIEQYSLQPFTLNILRKEQTLVEKLVSLIRFSFSQNPTDELSKKIRHFYDLYFLMNDSECSSFVLSDDFKIHFNMILNHDRTIFAEPEGWQEMALEESPLMIDFKSIWSKIKTTYQTELSALAYKQIPHEREIAINFESLIKNLI